MLKSYVAFDIETTGLSPEHNEIIEIGALKVREGKVVDRFIRFIESGGRDTSGDYATDRNYK